jgi:bidirectional [NiFe] hydrogenase diaphorase subunit
MSNVTIEIDGKKVETQEGANLLEVCRKAGADIPSLCYNEKLKPFGACRLCMVEVTKGKRTRLVASCCYPVEAGIAVKTSNDKINNIRKTLIELMMPLAATGPVDALAVKYGIKESRFKSQQLDCVLCGLCVRYCNEVKGDNAVYFTGRGMNRKLALLPGQAWHCASCRKCWELCVGGWITSGTEAMEEH